jgi:NAD(P)-dependent dehydrogenase (short-subunit alcohol dehydrogenase family)
MVKAIPQQRHGDPSDLDGALLLLASQKASGFMTGSTIVVDGGDMWTG